MLGIPLPFVLGAAPSSIVVEPTTPPITNDTVAAPHAPPRHRRAVAVAVSVRGVGARIHLGMVAVSTGATARPVGVGAICGVAQPVVSAGSSLRLAGLQGASGLGVTQVTATAVVTAHRTRAVLPVRDQIDRDWQQLQQAEDDEQVLALMGILR